MGKIKSVSLFFVFIFALSHNASAMESYTGSQDHIGEGLFEIIPSTAIIIVVSSSFLLLPLEIVQHILRNTNAFARTMFSLTSLANHYSVLSVQNPNIECSCWTDTLLYNRPWRARAIHSDIQIVSQRHIITINLISTAVKHETIEIKGPDSDSGNDEIKSPKHGSISFGKKSKSPNGSISFRRGNSPRDRIPMQVNNGEHSIFTDQPVVIHAGGLIFQAFQALLICDEGTNEPIAAPLGLSPLAPFALQKMVEIDGMIFLAHYWKGDISVINSEDLREAVYVIHLEGDARAILAIGSTLAVAHGDQVSLISTHLEKLEDGTSVYPILHSIPVGRRPERIILLGGKVLMVLCLGQDLRVMESSASVSIINLEDYL